MSFSGSSSESPPRKKKMRNQSDSNSDSYEKSDYELTTDYSKYVIIAENEFKTPGERGKSTEVAFHNAHWKIFGTRGEIFYRDRSIREKFKAGTRTSSYDEYTTSVVIRILEEKIGFTEKLADQWSPDVTFVVNGEKCEANRQYLANASPVFEKMLFGKFAEAKQSEIVLEGIGSADVFNDFLLAISPFGVQPNPANVLSLLKLAHQYDVPNLMRKCEEHLKFCYEIPNDERIFLAAEYDLNDLKAHTAHGITNGQWKKFWKEHKEKLLKPEFVCLFDMIMDRLK
ncbi:BTB/POZ domain-containing protein [Ditylenchus destructor]|nr:BTB/POZ domain-containing protein [Ditylenchus destructor]